MWEGTAQSVVNLLHLKSQQPGQNLIKQIELLDGPESKRNLKGFSSDFSNVMMPDTITEGSFIVIARLHIMSYH